jgi:hypothetical protein
MCGLSLVALGTVGGMSAFMDAVAHVLACHLGALHDRPAEPSLPGFRKPSAIALEQGSSLLARIKAGLQVKGTRVRGAGSI